jgi:hypothetical protein
LEVGCKFKVKVEFADWLPVILAGLGEGAGEGK